MGRIIMPPNPIMYPPPKAVGGEIGVADIVGRAMVVEYLGDSGDYCRIIDRLKWRGGGEEIRFTYYFRKPKGTDKDWIFGQGAGHMNPKTFVKLIKKAKTNPDFGDFGKCLDKINLD